MLSYFELNSHLFSRKYRLNLHAHANQALVTVRETIDLCDLFPKNAEVEIEIGFGKGGFLLERIKAVPDSYLLGIEIRNKWVKIVSERCEREGLVNIRVIAGNCLELVPRIKPGASVRRVFAHFPDPWWKKRHAKRRVIRDTLINEIARLLVPDGEFFLQTDVEERAFEYLALLRAHGGFQLPYEDRLVFDNPYFARSNREVRAEQDGLPIYRILAKRTALR
jgi:tRNA (guanine-N7-)-methyltransferase